MRQKVAHTTNWLTNSDPIEIAAELSHLKSEKRAEIFQRLPAEMPMRCSQQRTRPKTTFPVKSSGLLYYI